MILLKSCQFYIILICCPVLILNMISLQMLIKKNVLFRSIHNDLFVFNRQIFRHNNKTLIIFLYDPVNPHFYFGRGGRIASFHVLKVDA